MLPVMSLHDILVIFLAGLFIGVAVTAYTAYRVKKFFKTKLS